MALDEIVKLVDYNCNKSAKEFLQKKFTKLDRRLLEFREKEDDSKNRDDQGKHVNYLKNKKYFDLKKKENPIKTDADEMIEMINMYAKSKSASSNFMALAKSKSTVLFDNKIHSQTPKALQTKDNRRTPLVESSKSVRKSHFININSKFLNNMVKNFAVQEETDHLIPDEINYLDVYKNTEPHKPLPRAIVDFLKEATKSQDSKRALNQVKPINGVLSLNKSKTPKYNLQSQRNNFRSRFEVDEHDDSVSSLSRIEKPKLTDFEKAQARAKVEEKKNRRILRDLTRVQSSIPWNVELEHKLTEVRRYALQ